MKGESLVLLFSLVIIVMAAGCINILISAAALQDTGTGDVPPSPAIPERVPEDVQGTVQPTTPEPVEMAYLENLDCAVVEDKVATYRCMGKVRIQSGIYDEVQVIAKYPDNNVFESGVVAMGGSNTVLKSFILFPDLRYAGQEPQYFVRLDTARYPVIRNGSAGTAYINPPPTPPPPEVTTTNTLIPATGKPTVPVTAVTVMKTIDPGFSVTGIYPGNGPVSLQRYDITGSNFRQYPPPAVYLRKQGVSCEYCVVYATQVKYVSPTQIQCTVDMRDPQGGAGTYDVLVTNTYLADSYAVLKNGLVIK